MYRLKVRIQHFSLPMRILLDQDIYSQFLFTLFPTLLDRRGKSTSNIVPRLVKDPKRTPNPERVKEEEIDPQKHEIAGIQIRASGQPFRRKSHEPYRTDISQGICSSFEPLSRPQFPLQKDFRVKEKIPLTTINLRRRQHRAPKPHPSLIPTPYQPAHIHRQRASHKHSQQLQTNNRLVRARPPPIRPRILHPQPRQKPFPIPASVHAICSGSPAPARREPGAITTTRHSGRSGQGRGAEEGVVEEGPLENGVRERVKGVPDEEQAQFAGGGAWEEREGD